MNSKWVETDNDSGQAYTKIGYRRYFFVDTIWLDGDPEEWVAVGATVDLSDMTWHDMKCTISGYHDTIEGYLDSISVDVDDPNVDAIVDEFVAECVFENIASSAGYDELRVFSTQEEALRYVAAIKEHVEKRI